VLNKEPTKYDLIPERVAYRDRLSNPFRKKYYTEKIIQGQNKAMFFFKNTVAKPTL